MVSSMRCRFHSTTRLKGSWDLGTRNIHDKVTICIAYYKPLLYFASTQVLLEVATNLLTKSIDL